MAKEQGAIYHSYLQVLQKKYRLVHMFQFGNIFFSIVESVCDEAKDVKLGNFLHNKNGLSQSHLCRRAFHHSCLMTLTVDQQDFEEKNFEAILFSTEQKWRNHADYKIFNCKNFKDLCTENIRNMELDSEANIQYIICECGDNFPNQTLYQEHFFQNHTGSQNNSITLFGYNATKEEVTNNAINIVSKVQVPKSKVATNTKYERKPIYYITNKVVKEKVTIEPSTEMVESLEVHLEEHHAQEIMEELINIPIKGEASSENEDDDNGYEYQTIVTSENRIINEHNYDKCTAVTEFYCDMCGKSFDEEYKVKIHIETQHLRNNLTCLICNQVFTQPRFLTLHIRKKHDKDRPARVRAKKSFVCETCGGGFTSNAALIYHNRIHTGEKPYPCTICPKRFKMALQLQIHIRTHTGERPYECDLCPKKFSNRGALWRHNKVHTGEKPYECPECGKRFSQSNSMKLHIRTVHMKLPTPYKSKSRRQKKMKIAETAVEQETESYVIYEDYHYQE